MKQIVIKTPEEIAKMRHSGALLAKVFAMLDEVIVEGISTMEINDRAEAFIVEELKSRPASKGQYDFPCAQHLNRRCGVPRGAVGQQNPAFRHDYQRRHHAGKRRLYRRLQQDVLRRR